jgi:hypothetical protein
VILAVALAWSAPDVAFDPAVIAEIHAASPRERGRLLARLRASWSDEPSLAGAPIVLADAAIVEEGGSLRFIGTAEVWWTATATQRSITLRWLPHAFGGEITARSAGVDLPARATETLVEVPLEPPLSAGEGGALTLRFVVDVPAPPLPEDLGVFNASNLGLFATDGQIVALGHALPIVDGDARVLPQFGEHGRFPAGFWSARLEVPPGFVAVGATDGVRAGVREVGLAALRGDAGLTRHVAGPPAVTVYAAEAGEEIATHALGALRWHGERYGAYPWPSFTIVELPWLPIEGMEMSGFAFLRRGTSPAGMVAAHEVAHQWWYGIVGSDPRNHPWQDEALATYTAWRYWQDASGAAPPPPPDERAAAYLPGAAYDLPTYASAVYRQAPHLYLSLAEACGDRDLGRPLWDYADANRFGMAGPRAVVAALERACGRRKVDQAWRQWIQVHP